LHGSIHNIAIMEILQEKTPTHNCEPGLPYLDDTGLVRT